MEFRQKAGGFLFFTYSCALARQVLKAGEQENVAGRKIAARFKTNKNKRNPHGLATAISLRCLQEKARPNDRG